MRSELVHSAGLKVENRFLLATIVMHAVRKLHIQSTRTEDTANQILTDVARGLYIEAKLPELRPQPTIDLLPISPAA